MFFDFNIWAIVASAVAAVLVGFLWYMPQVFGRTWMKEAHVDAQEENETGIMLIKVGTAGIGACVLAWVLANFVVIWGALTVGGALELGFWIWLGFMAPPLLSSVLWEGKSLRYFAINAGYWFVVLEVVAVIVALWV